MRLTTLLLAAFVVFGAVFLFVIGIGALEGDNDFQFFADSSTYYAAARGDVASLEGPGDLINLASNYLGPVLLIRLTGGNYYIVLLLNACLLYFAVTRIGKALHFSSFKYCLVLFANPLTVSSVLSVNKDIISLPFLALLIGAYARRSSLAAVGSMLTSVLVRWQLLLIVPVVTLATTRLNPLRRHRALVLLVLLLSLSVLYVLLSNILEPIRQNFLSAAEEYEGSGVFAFLVSLQDRGLYWAVFPVKAAHLLFGMGLRFDRLLNPSNIYNDVWQLLHSTALLVLFLVLCARGRFRLDNDLIYLSLLYAAVFAITPIYTPRYFYPVYALWAAALVAPTRRVRFLTGRARAAARTPPEVAASPQRA